MKARICRARAKEAREMAASASTWKEEAEWMEVAAQWEEMEAELEAASPPDRMKRMLSKVSTAMNSVRQRLAT